jgi:O-antigen ligase
MRIARGNIAGLFLALYVLSGRWDFERLSEDSSLGIFSEMRVWVLFGFVLYAVLLGLRSREVILERRIDYLTKVLFPLQFALLGYVMITGFWAPDPELGGAKAYELGLMLASTFILLLCLVLTDGEVLSRSFWNWVLFITLPLVGVGFVKAVTSGIERVAVMGGGPNVFARIMGLCCMASLHLFQRKRNGYVWLIVTVVSSFLLVSSGSRGALLALGVSGGVFLVIERMSIGRVVIFGSAILFVVFIMLLFTPLGEVVRTSFERRVVDLVVEKGYDSSRLDLFWFAYHLGLRSPLFGGGLAAFPATGYHVYPHNLFAEVFCETGLLGVFLLCTVFGSFVWRIWRIRNSLSSITVSGLVFIFVASQFSGDLYDSRAIFVLLPLAALPGKFGAVRRGAKFEKCAGTRKQGEGHVLSVALIRRRGISHEQTET